jgi:hypothetical protein
LETLNKPRAASRRKILPDEALADTAASNAPDADTVLVFLGRIRQEEARVAMAKKRLAKLWKLALNAGIVRKDLELVRKFADQDPDAVLATIGRIRQYAQWLEVPLGSQLSLLDIPTSSILSSAELGERAFRAGYVLGITGLNPDEEAYPMGHERRTRHHDGWSAGQKVLLDRIQPIDIALEADGGGNAAAECEPQEAA